jgi:hypothetical protein
VVRVAISSSSGHVLRVPGAAGHLYLDETELQAIFVSLVPTIYPLPGRLSVAEEPAGSRLPGATVAFQEEIFLVAFHEVVWSTEVDGSDEVTFIAVDDFDAGEEVALVLICRGVHQQPAQRLVLGDPRFGGTVYGEVPLSFDDGEVTLS